MHAKSPCCGATIRRFGRRRRQCASCNRTWTIRPRKRGRPPNRTAVPLLEKVFLRGFTLRQLRSRKLKIGLSGLHYRFRQALCRMVARPSPQRIPPGPLVLLADGLWFDFDARPWVLYLTALKPCSGKHAVFLDPLLFPDKEGASRWAEVVSAIPAPVKRRIRGLVVDNLPGMQLLARRHRWVLQLCHFHLLLKLQMQRRGVRHALRGGPVREELHALLRQALTLPAGAQLQAVLGRLRDLSKSDCGTVRIQTTIRQFLWEIAFYRSYLTHPELHLPTTNNAVESMGRVIREMFRRSRAGSNPKSVLLWAKALIRLRPNITCNGA